MAYGLRQESRHQVEVEVRMMLPLCLRSHTAMAESIMQDQDAIVSIAGN